MNIIIGIVFLFAAAGIQDTTPIIYMIALGLVGAIFLMVGVKQMKDKGEWE